jgi:hypothetical protein
LTELMSIAVSHNFHVHWPFVTIGHNWEPVCRKRQEFAGRPPGKSST